jgi:4-hydroxybenzoate polyprenyltransferase
MGESRSRAGAYLRLSRVSNLPTVWTNVLAGIVITGSPVVTTVFLRLSIAVSLMYTAGMFLNDAFDVPFDSVHRRDRPIVAGVVSRSEVFTMGFLLLGVGLLAIGWSQAMMWGLVLAAAIVYYDWQHKHGALGRIVMGMCRGLVYCVAASATAGIRTRVVVAAVVLTLYVVGLTSVAKMVGQRAGVLIPLLVAGISLVDAVFILAAGSGALALLAASAFVATLALQRVVAGT